MGAFLASAPAFAGPEAQRILSSSVGKFLMAETAEGRALIAEATGRAFKPGDSLEGFLARLDEPAIKLAAERFETRLSRVETEFRRQFPHAVVGAQLGAEERSILRILASRDLDGGAIQFVAARDGVAQAHGRRLFTTSVSGDSLTPTQRFPHGVDPVAQPKSVFKFGFESEYTMKEIEKLLSVYGPAPEFGIAPDRWLAMESADRVNWVKARLGRLFPEARAMGKLIKISQEPELKFLPEKLLLDSTGNLEIVLPPFATFEEWKRGVFLINERLGTGSMQGTMGTTNEAFFGSAGPQAPATLMRDNRGFLNFHSDLDTLEKLDVGAARFAKDPTKPAANSFNHPFLGPMTALKQGKLVQYLDANSRGLMLDTASLRAVAWKDSSFKYFGGTAYRPDIAKGFVILEVRDAHNNVEALVERMSRNLVYGEEGRGAFAQASELPAFDSRHDFTKLPKDVQEMLPQLFPAKVEDGARPVGEELLALEVFRNFAYPLRDWRLQIQFLNRPALHRTVRFAQWSYLNKLAAIAGELKAGRITAEQASLEVQGALATFSVDSKLTSAYRLRSRELLQETRAAAGPQAPAGGIELRDAG